MDKERWEYGNTWHTERQKKTYGNKNTRGATQGDTGNLGPGGSLLGVGGDLDGQLDTALQRITCALVHRFHTLDVDARHHQPIGDKAQVLPQPSSLIKAKDS